MNNYSRRQFVQFMGRSGMVGAGMAAIPSVGIFGCGPNKETPQKVVEKGLPFKPIAPSDADELVLADGFKHHIITKWQDPISDQDSFGFNNDYTAFIPLENDSDGLLWVNHEYPSRMFVSCLLYTSPSPRDA